MTSTTETTNGRPSWFVVYYDTPTRKAREREFDAGQGTDARKFAARMGGTLRAVFVLPGTVQTFETDVVL